MMTYTVTVKVIRNPLKSNGKNFFPIFRNIKRVMVI